MYLTGPTEAQSVSPKYDWGDVISDNRETYRAAELRFVLT